MSYELHITRRDFWSDTGQDIAIEEWHAAVDADPELTMRPDKGPHVAVWTGPGAVGEPCIEWRFGEVVSKNPTNAFIDKMVALAPKLGARLQGDYGEPYGLTDAPIPPMPTLRKRIAAWLAGLRGK